MNELTTIQTSGIQKPSPAASDIEVIAETPQEMQESNLALIEWCKRKIDAMKVDFIELDAAYKSAVEKKWKSSTLKRHAEMAKKRIEFYRKIKTALERGFYIVPNFPVTLFAIRTNRDAPLELVDTSTHNYRQDKEQRASALPVGEGSYKNPFPLVHCDREIETENGKTTTYYTKWAEAWDKFEFPISMARPRIMEATSRAMALKLFDDLGVLPAHRKADPLIVARIKDPRSTKYQERFVSFIVAWALDTRTL